MINLTVGNLAFLSHIEKMGELKYKITNNQKKADLVL